MKKLLFAIIVLASISMSSNVMAQRGGGEGGQRGQRGGQRVAVLAANVVANAENDLSRH